MGPVESSRTNNAVSSRIGESSTNPKNEMRMSMPPFRLSFQPRSAMSRTVNSGVPPKLVNVKVACYPCKQVRKDLDVHLSAPAQVDNFL